MLKTYTQNDCYAEAPPEYKNTLLGDDVVINDSRSHRELKR